MNVNNTAPVPSAEWRGGHRTYLQSHERHQSGGGRTVAQAQRHVVAAQQPAAVHRAHVGRRGAHHFDETAHGRGARRAGQRVPPLVVGRHNGRLPVRGCRGRRGPERRRRERFLRTSEKKKKSVR